MGKVKNTKSAEELVNNTKGEGRERHLLFSFSDFRATPINMAGFNNYYKDEHEYVRKMTAFLGKMLPLLSNEQMSLFDDINKMNVLHLHQIKGDSRLEKVREILRMYEFSKHKIDDIMEGERLYQIELLYENGATRVVFERIDEMISFLFMDPNHHIYFDKSKVDAAHSLYFEYCPEQLSGKCDFFNASGDCYVDEYLDVSKFFASFSNSYDPDKQS